MFNKKLTPPFTFQQEKANEDVLSSEQKIMVNTEGFEQWQSSSLLQAFSEESKEEAWKSSFYGYSYQPQEQLRMGGNQDNIKNERVVGAEQR